MKKKKRERTIEFEAEYDNAHITAEETFVVAHDMYEALHESCPGCCLNILSVLVSMLAIGYIKKGEKGGIIFPHEKWIEDIIKNSRKAVNSCEHMGTSVN